ncbi:SMC family ATPase, partial [Intrasporangium calvum]
AALKRAEAAVTTARSRLHPEHRELTAAELRVAASTTREMVGSLTSAAEVEGSLGLHRTRLAELLSRADRTRTALDRATTELTSLPAAIAAHEQSLTAARHLHSLLDARTAAAAQAKKRLEAATHEAAARARLPEAEERAAAALTTQRAGEGRLAELRQARIDDIAGELGLTLADGRPCPVCGSVEHPSPARPTPDAVTPEQVAAQEEHVETLRARVTEATDRLARLRAEIAALAAAADGLDVDAATAVARRAAAELTASLQAADAVTTTETALADLRGRSAELTDRATELTAEAARSEDAATQLSERLDADTAVVEAARDGHPSVSARRAALVETATRIDALVDALAGRDAARASVAEDEAARDADLAAAGFADVAEWLAADQPVEWIAAREKEIADFENACTRVKAGLSGPELADVQLDTLFDDIDQMVELERAAKKEMEAATNERGSLRDQVRRTKERVTAIRAALERNADCIAETADAVRLGQLVAGNGDNQLNLDLAKYVLIRRFAEVLAAANTELARFSGGRYSLEHTDAKKGNAKSGLGVRVQDMHTNQVRDVGTLSGGETFYVSLSLALALAEVVRSESGGVDLGTLFVDEGFGTLDPDVLDDVMHTLEGLRAGGRTVGIVSHVTELKSRVADRIEILVNEDRTSTLRVTA